MCWTCHKYAGWLYRFPALSYDEGEGGKVGCVRQGLVRGDGFHFARVVVQPHGYAQLRPNAYAAATDSRVAAGAWH